MVVVMIGILALIMQKRFGIKINQLKSVCN
jgi:hypothetical protein